MAISAAVKMLPLNTMNRKGQGLWRSFQNIKKGLPGIVAGQTLDGSPIIEIKKRSAEK